MAEIHRTGFTLLSGKEDARSSSDRFRLNIIFVHGLRGHPRTTWTETINQERDGTNLSSERNFFSRLKKPKARQAEHEPPARSSEIFWPEDFLAADIPEARVWTYGYNADIIGWFYQASNQNTVSQHSQDLANKLQRELDNEDPIIFVAHSLGGILVKDALQNLERCRQRVKAIVFLGTPHRGSAYADWAQIASNFAQLGLQDTNKKISGALGFNDEVLNRIHREFKRTAKDRGIRIFSFQEAKGIIGIKGLHNKVVDDVSSKLDLDDTLETVETLDANHMQMARCTGKTDARYRAISGVLRQMARHAQSTEAGFSASTSNTSPTFSIFIMPFARDNAFVGRETILADVATSLSPTNPTSHRRAALVGLGGIGKSQVAVEYAYRVRDQASKMPIFWIHASNADRFKQGYRMIADRAQLPGRNDPQVDVLQLVFRWLSEEANGRWLMILDNVDDDNLFFSNDEQPLESYIPQTSNGSILITSRNSDAATNLLGGFGDVVEMRAMSDQEALQLLETKISLNACQDEAEDLVRTLEYIPLAIIQAAAYIKMRKRMTISKYLQLFHQSEENQAHILSDRRAQDLRRDASNRVPILTTWQITFDQIRSDTPSATDLLALMSMFDRQGIPKFLVQGDMDELQFEDALAPLTSFSLVREQQQGGSFEMHRLVQLSTRKWLELHGEHPKWLSAALQSMVEAFPSGEHGTWSACRTLLPHARGVLAQPPDKVDSLNHVNISCRVGWYLRESADYTTGEAVLRAGLRVGEQLLGAELPDTLVSVSHLAVILENQGKYKEAERLDRQVLERREEILGPKHPKTLISVNNLARALQNQGHYDEAERLNRRALEGREEIFGLTHPDTLNSVNNLALVLQNQGQYREAESLHRRALEGLKEVLGPEHPFTLTSMANLASTYWNQERWEETMELEMQALETSKTKLGEEHPDTLISMNNLAFTWRSLGRHTEAHQLMKDCVYLRSRVLGIDHPDTVSATAALDRWQTESKDKSLDTES